jgi:putative two-component system response regulator
MSSPSTSDPLERILLVDDDPLILVSSRRALEGRFHITTAQSGTAALALLGTERPFAVIVSDLKMPGIDGIELLTRCHSISPDTVRILLTGHTRLEYVLSAINSGHVYTFLTKPTAIADLIQVIEKGLEQRDLRSYKTDLYALQKVKDAMEGVILGFSALVEARDPYTAGHQRSATRLALAIARQMGMSDHRCDGLRLASMIHDLGKLYVPTEFLNRPGRLSDVEFAIIKTHPTVGAEILKPVEFPWPVGDIVLQHHERMDGSGYPQGLRGPDIMLEARILAAADVVDAMTFHRPYRPALGVTAALEELERGKGETYDADVVEACMAVFQAGFQVSHDSPAC